MIEIALYQPDIPPNTATILRYAACLGLKTHIIEPAGFQLSDRSFRRAGMDYIDPSRITRHVSWETFQASTQNNRLVLATTKSQLSYLDFSFQNDDIVLFGRESAGVPDHVHNFVEARITVPMQPDMRSLNVAMSCAMICGEALRQTGGLPA